VLSLKLAALRRELSDARSKAEHNDQPIDPKFTAFQRSLYDAECAAIIMERAIDVCRTAMSKPGKKTKDIGNALWIVSTTDTGAMAATM